MKASSVYCRKMNGYKFICLATLWIHCSLVFVRGERIFTNEFAVKLSIRDKAVNHLAEQHGFVNRGQIGSLKGFYVFEHHALHKRSLEASREHQNLLQKNPAVLWVEQQHVKQRVKREMPGKKVSFTDPLYPDQWFLHGGGLGGFDMNVLPAWKEGYTGKGIVVSILDDGIQTNHPDLTQNYDKEASLDINGQDNDPTPRDNGDNKHGTRCAGEVAAVAFNNFCGVGVAYNASIGGVRMLDGSVTDVTEATALSHNPDHIHIYSASWGPEDDGQTVDGPGPLAKLAFAVGIKKGRSGLGSIFVWASGNGGRYSDSCNCDGYTNSIYTLSISSATQSGTMPWYLEQCSSTLATTYSSGSASKDKSITTVDMDNTYFKDIGKNRTPDPLRLCTKSHTGTSASAPIAAGICALALEANPCLTWRDMQYLVMLTSRPEPLQNEDGWVKNGVERLVSSKFGYGLMDAAAMVKLAKQWRTVGAQCICETAVNRNERMIPANHGSYLEVNMNTSSCRNTKNYIAYLEHVQVKVTLYFKPRGNLKIVLVSPAGTPSTVLLPRPHDIQEGSFKDWPFMSVHFWGERAEGLWKLFIINDGRNRVLKAGKLTQWSLIFYGIKRQTVDMKQTKRTEYRSYETEDNYGKGNAKELQNFNEISMSECSSKKKFQVIKPEITKCVEKCDRGQYSDTRNFICRPCDKSCLTCFGPSYDNCLSCPKKLFLSKNFCLKSCPDGFYADSERWECLPCAEACLTCEHSRDFCLSCAHHMLLLNHTCVSSCEKNTFLYNFACKPCHSSCSSCFGKSRHECLSCPKQASLINDTCVSECPDKYYRDDSGICRKCKSTCKSCDGISCTECISGWTKQSDHCISDDSCGNGWYNNVSGVCNACFLHCASCSGHGDVECLHCVQDFYLLGGRCVEICPNGFYGFDGECHYCEKKCKVCSVNNSSSCLICERGFSLYDGNCMTSCPLGFYPDSEGRCQNCDPLCKHCQSGEKHDCTSCHSDHYLINHACLPSCPDSYFPIAETSECVPCYHLCRTCTGFGPTFCTSCYKNSAFTDGMCVPCLDHEYYDETSQTCQRCNSKCGRCHGPSEFNCLSCEAPMRLNETNHLCLPCCNQTLPKTSQCCACSKNLDVCINVVEHTRSVDGENYEVDSFYQASSVNDVMPIVIAICAAAVVLFVILFFLLQAHSMGCCQICYKITEYERVPNTLVTRFDTEMESVSLTQDEGDEDDIYEKA